MATILCLTEFSNIVENPDGFFSDIQIYDQISYRGVFGTLPNICYGDFFENSWISGANYCRKKLHHRWLTCLYIRFCLCAKLAITLESSTEITLKMNQNVRRDVKLWRYFDLSFFIGFGILWITDFNRIHCNSLNFYIKLKEE